MALPGFGESSPRLYVTGEDCLSVIDMIKESFSKILFSSQVNSLDDIKNILNELEKECIKKNKPNYTSALGAIDIALLDAFGKINRNFS